MIRCPYTRDAVRDMIPIFRSDEQIARRVSNSAYSVSTADVRAMRRRPRKGR